MHQVKAVLLMHGRQAVVRVSIHSNWNTRGYTTSTVESSIVQYSKEGCPEATSETQPHKA
jgi:hypothetical protein